MKKTLLFLTLTGIGFIISADSDEMRDMISKLSSESIIEPADLMKKWQNLEAKKLLLGAQEDAAIVQQLQDPVLKARYEKIVASKKALAQQLNELPVPQQTITKSLKNMAEWKKIAAEAKLLTSEQLQTVATQTNKPFLLKIAEKKAKKARKILDALASSGTIQPRMVKRSAPISPTELDERSLQFEIS